MTKQDIEERLKTCIPEWVYTLDEFKQLNSSVIDEILVLNNRLEELENNQFIFQADNEGLKKYETMYNLPSDIDIEIRRLNIYNFINSNMFFTSNWLKNYLDLAAGNDNWICTVKNYVMTVGIKNIKQSILNTIYNDLRKKIPANIELTVKILEAIETNCYTGFYVQSADIITI